MRYDPAGALTYLHSGETKLELFTYTITNISGASASGNISITVSGLNNPPVTASDTILRQRNRSTKVPVATLISNDHDPEGDSLALLHPTRDSMVIFTPQWGTT